MVIRAEKKLAGLLVPAFALRRPDDLGIGDTEAVREAIDFCSANQIAVLQLLPTNETGGDNSPYNTISAVALDPALITVSPDMVPGLTQEQFEKIASPEKLSSLRGPSIDYPHVKRLKIDLLEAAFDNFSSEDNKNSKQRAAFEAFKLENKDWLEDYSLFRTLVDEHNGNARWTEWDKAITTASAAFDWLNNHAQSARLKRACQFWSFAQWLAAEQWSELKAYAEKSNVSLMGDVPFGVSRYSADVWANQHLFDLEWSGGAPPETFFQGDQFTRRWGQNWGIPLYNWRAHKTEGYAWWRRRIGHTEKYCHYFRIDHVLGFFRVYAFPWLPEHNQEFSFLSDEDASARTGGRLPHFVPRDDYPEQLGLLNCDDGKKLLEMIISVAGKTGVVAEDLGVVPWYVRPLLKELGIPGFAIPIFERLDDRSFRPKESLPPLSLCTYGTHDHHPLASYYEELVAWWHGPDGDNGWHEVQRLMNFLGLPTNDPPTQYSEALQFAFFKALLESPCWLAMFMITDVLGTKQRFNEPGLSGDYNWSQRLDQSLLDYKTDPRYTDKIKCLNRLIKETNRTPTKPVEVIS